MEKTAVSIGFDTGISSVGWCVLCTKTGKVLETGVNLFSSATAEKNIERRNFRQMRRIIRRRKTRLSDLKKLLVSCDFEYPQERLSTYDHPYLLRVRGLTEKLTKEEVAIAIYHLIKRRGISYSLTDINEEEQGSDYKKQVNQNQQALLTKTPGEIQYERLIQNKKVRGNVQNALGETVLNVFPTKNYEAEAKKILMTQQVFYPELTDERIQKILAILTRKRKYFKGPGSKKSRTDYGIYRTDGNDLNNLFKILIGKDKIFPEECRAASNSYSAQLFNLLNDLNNLHISSTEDGKLTQEHKETIIHELKTTTKNVRMRQLIAKVTETPIEQITGYRIDRKNNPEIHSLAVYRTLNKECQKFKIDIGSWPTNFFDEFAPIVTLNTEVGEIRKEIERKGFREKYSFLTDECIELLLKNPKWFQHKGKQKWHNFSLKTMNILIPEMLRQPKDQMTLIYELGLNKEEKNKYQNKSSIPIKSFTEEIYNPVVRKSVKETIKVFNALYQKYPKVEYIVIEMPREDNAEQEKKDFQAFQRQNEAEKETCLKEFCHYLNINDTTLNNKLYSNRQLATKIRYWYQQEEKCPYSGKNISAEDLFHHPEWFEIDHIIPLSVSFDDSLNNKVLCYADMNQEKGKMTPYEMMKNGKGQPFESLSTQLKKNKRMSAAKKNHLLFTENLADIEVRKRFIARNLVDTRYASKKILNELQSFVLDKQLPTKVTVVRGKFTSMLRKRWKLNKSRETYYHHAIDATIIAATPMLALWKKEVNSLIPANDVAQTIQVPQKDTLSEEDFCQGIYQLPYQQFVEQLNHLNKQVKFNHQVDKKSNRKISDASIYTTRKVQLSKDKQREEYVLGKIENIYTIKGYERFKKIYEKNGKEVFLMAHFDPKTFEKLEKIMSDYPEVEEIIERNGKVKPQKVSPFELYRREHGYVKKYAKKNNGPTIKQLKIYDNKLGTHVDVTPPTAQYKKVILQSLKPWRTDVYYNHKTQEYEIMGIKYADLMFGSKGMYGIKQDTYEQIKQKEGISATSEFLFSLYKKDRIKVINKDDNQSVELIYHARTSNKGVVELKPVDKYTFDKTERVAIYDKVSNGRLIKKMLKKNYMVYKVNTDILGNPFYIKKERDQPTNLI